MKIQKLFLAVLSSSVLCTSCMDNFLDTESPSIPSDENLFKSTALTEAALMGVFATMTDTYIYGQKLCVNWQGASDVEVGSGAFSTENYNSTLRDEGAGNFYDDNYNRNTRWDKLYYLAESATTIVDGIRRSPLMQSTSDKAAMRRYLGEALALKALGYFELIRYWGDVPYKEHASESGLGNVYIGKVDRDIVYNYIIEDLKEAIEYLPWMGEESYTVERMNKGFAKGLLAKVALFAGGWSVRDGNQFPDLDVEHHPTIPEMNGYFVGRPKNWKDYYELAAKQCAEILGATDNPHELDPSYENIWSTVNHLEYNKYNENLFEVAFGEGQNGDVGATMGYNLNRGVFNTTQGMGGAGYAATTAYYFYSFDPADTRRDVTCVFQEYINENGKNKEVIRCNPLGVACGKWRWYWMTDNYMKVRFPKANSRIATGINWILMRYSDIYLMFAEAQNVLTGPDAVSPIAGMSPRQALEKVRERAFGTGAPEITQYDADFFTAIVNERAWEFGCESIRRQDLTRWGLLAEKIEEMKIGLCMLYDYKPVTIFGKTYQVDEIPRKIYYKYEDSDNPEYIDMSSVNFNEDMGTGTASASKGQYECNWISMQVTLNKDGDINATLNTNYVKTMARILVCGTGLNASYDYSNLFGRLNWGGEAEAEFRKYSVGNGVCNYRHVFAIYYEDVNKTQGYVSNSYGYK